MNEQKPQENGFKKEIGLFGGMSVICGIMIGSGIFYLGSYVLQRSGYSLGLALICWLVGGLVSLLGGLCFAELGASDPKAGGQLVYLSKAYHPVLGFMYGFTQWILASSGSIAAIAVAIPTALVDFIPGLTQLHIKLIAIALIVLLTLFNLRGVKGASNLQTVFMVAKLLPIFIIMIGALALGNHSPDLTPVPAAAADGSPVTAGSLFGMIAFATVASLWAYEGWTNLNAVAEEIKNVKRNLPLAIILGIGGVAIFYALFNYSLLRVIPLDEAKSMIESGSLYLGTTVAERLFGVAGKVIVLIGMLLAMFNCLNGMVLAFSRIYYAMSAEKIFFKKLGTLNRNGVPAASLFSQMIISIILVCLRNLDQLTSLVVFCGMLFNCLAVTAVFVYRRKYPDLERPYKVWLYPVSVVITVILFVGLMVNNLLEDPVTALTGLIVPVVGIFFYIYFRKKYSEEEKEDA